MGELLRDEEHEVFRPMLLSEVLREYAGEGFQAQCIALILSGKSNAVFVAIWHS